MPRFFPLVVGVLILLSAPAVHCAEPATVTGDHPGRPPVSPAGAVMEGPVFNQDDTEFFFDHSASEMSGALVDTFVDQVAASGIRTFVSCVNGMRTNYASRVWEPDWQGYDPKGPNDQPILRYLAPAALGPTRRRLDSARRLAELGINFNQRALARCRQRGLGAWVSVRMNDVHDCMLEDAPLLSGFFKAERSAGLLREPYRDSFWPDRALDWERPEVQEHYFALVREQLQTLDLDGLELDWMRFVYHFRPGHELAGGRIITAWMWRVRAECDRAAQRLGHPVYLAVRVPSHPETARRCGLDAVAWAHAGLVDVVVAAPFWATTEFDMPMLEWKRLLAGTKARLAGGIEIRYQPVPNGPAKNMSPELVAGAAMAILYHGADMVYLYNYHPVLTWGVEPFRRVVQSLQSEARLDRLPRIQAVTFRDIRAPGEPADNALPATDRGQDFPWPPGCAFRLATGPKPIARAVELNIEFTPGTLAPEKLRVFVNSVECHPRAGSSGLVRTYPVPDEIMQDEAQVVEVMAPQRSPFTIVRLELSIAAKT